MVSLQSCRDRFDDLRFYQPDDPWLYDLLKEKIDPQQIFQRQGYTKDDMMNYLLSVHKSGYSSYFGSQKAGVVFRNYHPNEYILEPHIVGTATNMRTVMRVGIDFIFTSTKVLKINNYTHLKSSKNICLAHGFTLEGTIKNTYLDGDQLIDVYVLGLSKKDYLNDSHQ